jgi:signal transduction histidine kinase
MARRTLLITYIAVYLLAVGAVTRYLIGFRDHRFWSIAFLLGGYLLILVSEPLLSRRNRPVTYIYLLVQTAIICALSLIAPNVDFWAMLFCPLVVQVMHNFPQRTGFLMTGILTVIMSVLMLSGLGPQVGLPLIFVYGVVYFLLAAFIAIIREAEAAHDESQKLLGELQEAHHELQAYAEQAEELAAAAERKRSREALEAAHAFQQSVIDGVADSIMVIGVDRRVKLMNRAAREFSSGLPDASKPFFCYEVFYGRKKPCDEAQHPCPLGEVRQSGRPVTVVHERYRPDGERRFVEVVAAPLLGVDGTFEGIIESLRDITERLEAKEALQRYADRLRALAARLAEVAEVERQRLARELHDRVGQNLTALGINLNIIRSQMAGQGPEPVGTRLDDSLLLVEQTTERIRDVMSDLRPPVLDDYGLVAALHWYGERLAQRTGIAVDVEGEELVPRPPARVENALFRIAQEALTNVTKHAQATNVTVTVELDTGTLRLIVADDGVGFEPAQPSESDGDQGWGLLHMTERAEAANGRCRIESQPGHGARVIAEVAQ